MPLNELVIVFKILLFESYSASISVFIILNKGVSFRDGHPKFVGGTNTLLEISFLSF